MKILKYIQYIIISLIIFSPTLEADIFYYKDENGTLHFTNSPESQNSYKVFRRNVFKNWYPTTHDQTRYESVILEAARTYDIDHTLIKAVIKAESNFNPRAVSPKGARGLMQIMPDNFRTLGVYNPFDPRQNIMGGTRYLRQLFNKFDNLTLALAAYNAGPTAVSTYNNIPPYKETQQYVKRVLRYYRSYNGFH
ncbi:Lytic transglycosylase-like, catalytic domain protein [Candidatus Magnetomorum sp. HK-1]|nr:Lytic transglycosylase-like, catalytic domain protein [Candidatus Magnetomorum sp. HK-1]